MLTERGSTLIELIVVLAIIAILFGVAIPALTAAPPSRAGVDLDSLRSMAVRRGVIVRGDSVLAFPDGRVVRTGGSGGR